MRSRLQTRTIARLLIGARIAKDRAEQLRGRVETLTEQNRRLSGLTNFSAGALSQIQGNERAIKRARVEYLELVGAEMQG